MSTDKTSSRTGLKTAALIVAALVIYILSAGPVHRYFFDMPPAIQQGIQWLYTPLSLLDDCLPGQPINDYARMWEK